MKQILRLHIAKWVLSPVFVLAILVGTPSIAIALADSTARSHYQDAVYLLNKGHWKNYTKVKSQLTDYVLYPYLEYAEQKKRIKFNRSPQVQQFLDTYPDFVLNWNLRHRWIRQLAKKRDWQGLLAAYQPTSDASIQCYMLRAKLATKTFVDEDIAHAKKLWTVGKSQPRACDPVFKHLTNNNLITKQDYWARIQLAMAKGKTSLAKYLGTKLPAKEAKQVALWRNVHRRPATYLEGQHLPSDTEIGRDIIVHGLKRLARRDAETAFDRWQLLSTKYTFTEAQVAAVMKQVSVSGATQFVPQSHEWFSAIPSRHFDESTHDWHVRSALRHFDWEGAFNAINQMPHELQSSNVWQYWRARSLDEIGYEEDAREIFTEVANNRSYYGFLASDFLNTDPTMTHIPIDLDKTLFQNYRSNKRLHAAYEFYQMDDINSANREWNAMLKELPESSVSTAAYLAHLWGWHRQAITTLYKGGFPDDLDIRFPTPYKKTVLASASKQNIDPAWVFSVIRKESAFDKNARSSADARGLMQLLPATGKATAKLIKQRFKNANTLYTPETNIALGSAYLKQMKARFNENAIMATAAYNAGPHRIKQWVPEHQAMPADIWIETIPFKETRNYAQSVTAFTSVFQWRLGLAVEPISNRLKLIAPKNLELAENQAQH